MILCSTHFFKWTRTFQAVRGQILFMQWDNFKTWFHNVSISMRSICENFDEKRLRRYSKYHNSSFFISSFLYMIYSKFIISWCLLNTWTICSKSAQKISCSCFSWIFVSMMDLYLMPNFFKLELFRALICLMCWTEIFRLATLPFWIKTIRWRSIYYHNRFHKKLH